MASSVVPKENWVTRGWRYGCWAANFPQRSTAFVRAGSRALQERSWWVRSPVGAGVGHNRHLPSFTFQYNPKPLIMSVGVCSYCLSSCVGWGSHAISIS